MRTSIVAVSLAVLSACGGGGGGTGSSSTPNPTVVTSGTDGGGTGLPLLPLAVGNRWGYRATDGSTKAVTQKETKVVDFRAMDGVKAGVQAYVLESVDGTSKSVVFLETASDFARRHREDSYESGTLTETAIQTPWAIRGPEAMPQSAGVKWQEEYTEDTYAGGKTLIKSKDQSYQWAVDSLADRVVVPAGSFDALRLKRVKSSSGKVKTTWWVAGVGKVREDDDGTIEELTDWNVK